MQVRTLTIVTPSVIIMLKIEVYPKQSLGTPISKPCKSLKAEKTTRRYQKAGYGPEYLLTTVTVMC